MKNFLLLLLLALFCCVANPASAQTKDTTQYFAYSYHKVAPGMDVWPMLSMAPKNYAGSPPTIAVYNYFKTPPCKTLEAAIDMEETIWKPIHEARIKDNHLQLWFLFKLDFPFGASQPYDMLTIDDYNDMDQYLAPVGEDYFKKVHPGKNMKNLLKKTAAATTLVKGDVRMIIYRQ